MTGTKERILDSAERLFAENGFAATSVRHVIADAGVNLAAVHYYFGTKEELWDEVILRRIRSLDSVRIARLDELEAAAGDAPVPLEQTLDAFFAPAGELAVRHPHWVRIMGRMHAEGYMHGFVKRHPIPAMDRFSTAIRRAVSHLSEEEFRLRKLLMFGAMSHLMAWAQAADFKPPNDAPRHLAAVITYLAGGWRAPAMLPKETETTICNAH